MNTPKAHALLRDAVKLLVEASPKSQAVEDPSTKPEPKHVQSSGEWIPWPSSVKHIPFETLDRKGIGPGEKRLEKILHGQVMGGGVSYDVVDSDGNKWEVKKPTGREIRPGTEGMAAVQVAFGKIKNVVERIDSVFGSSRTRPRTAAAAAQVMGPDVIEKIRGFIVSEGPLMMKGEVSKGRMAALLEVLHLINAALESGAPDNDDGTKYVEMGDEDIKIKKNIDTPTYVKLGKVLNLGAKDLGVNPSDILKSTFNSPAFRDPDTFMENTWNRAALASDVFGHTSGVILVSPVGYRIVPKENLDNVIVFNRITKGFPHFKVVG